MGENAQVRVSAKADYALRAMAQLVADSSDGAVAAPRLAEQQGIPLKFLHGVLTDLKRARLVRSTRGPDGGFELMRPATEITLADILRAVEGPLVNIHDTSLTDLTYPGPAEKLLDVWMAARATMRNVFETVTVADLAAGNLPESVLNLATQYRVDHRHGV
jgi:Rrf2 family protein